MVKAQIVAFVGMGKATHGVVCDQTPGDAYTTYCGKPVSVLADEGEQEITCKNCLKVAERLPNSGVVQDVPLPPDPISVKPGTAFPCTAVRPGPAKTTKPQVKEWIIQGLYDGEHWETVTYSENAKEAREERVTYERNTHVLHRILIRFS